MALIQSLERKGDDCFDESVVHEPCVYIRSGGELSGVVRLHDL